jgi:hypothetical protein
VFEIDAAGGAHVDQDLRVARHLRRECRQWNLRARDEIADQQAREQPVAGRGVLAEDDVPRLFTADRDSALVHGCDDVAVADRCFDDLDPRIAQCVPQPEVRHHRDDDRAGVRVEREHRHDLVTVDQRAVLVDGEDPVGVAVEREPERGTAFNDGALQRLGMGRSTSIVDVATVGFGMDHGHVGARVAQHAWPHRKRGTVRAVDHDAQTGEGSARERTEQVPDVQVEVRGVGRLVDRRHRAVTGRELALDRGFDVVGQLAAVATDYFDAVVSPRVVTGRDDRGRRELTRSRERDRGGWHHAEQHRPDVLGRQSGGELRHDARSRHPWIATDEQRGAFEHSAQGAAQPDDEIGSELSFRVAAYAVGSEPQHGA